MCLSEKKKSSKIHVIIKLACVEKNDLKKIHNITTRVEGVQLNPKN